MSLSIQKNQNTLSLSGRLDTGTAPTLERELSELLPTVDALTLDLEHLEYISSAGLRVILKVQKALANKGGLTVTHVPEAVQEVFDITGFSDFLTIV